MRFSQWKQQDFKARLANTPAELEEILTPMADAGVDVFDASVRTFQRAEFPAQSGPDGALNLAGWAKKITGRLSMTVGGIGLNEGLEAQHTRDTLELLMERFARGEFDLVGVGRALLQDPGWTRKARLGEAFEPFSTDALHVLT